MDGKLRKSLGTVSEQVRAVMAACLLVRPPFVFRSPCLRGATWTAELDALLPPGQLTRRQLEIVLWCDGRAAGR